MMETADDLRAFVYQLCDEEKYDAEEGKWIFSRGGDCFRCADSAAKIVRRFGGRVVGYFSARNTAALIGSVYGEGHDFALVSNRYLVDNWAFSIARLIDDPVMDLDKLHDLARSRVLYGDESTWEDVAISRDQSEDDK
jgi:hypothetical protein